MNILIFNRLVLGLLVSIFCGSKNDQVSPALTQNKQEFHLENEGWGIQKEVASRGVTQISGIGYQATNAECNSASQGALYAIRMTGDLEGCLFTYIDEYECSPSGTYREIGREYFVGTYNGKSGTFLTTYKFEAKYEGCAADGAPLGAEIFGRCQHPLVDGSGNGVFDGVTGRLAFKDDIQAANYIYRGQLKY